MTGDTDYTGRQAAYDLCNFGAKTWSPNPAAAGAATSHPGPPAPSPPYSPFASTSSSRSLPASAAPAATQTRHLDPIDRDYEKIRINMQILFHDLGINVNAPRYRQHPLDRDLVSA